MERAASTPRAAQLFILFCQAQEMAKAVKAPIRTKTEASRDVYDGAEGGAVRDEAWFNAQNPKRVTS